MIFIRNNHNITAEGEARAIRLQAGTDSSSSSDSSSDSSSSEGGRGPKNKNLDSSSYYTSNVAASSTKPGRHHRMSIHRHSSEHHLPLHHFSFYPEGSALSSLLVEVVSEETNKSCPTAHVSVDCSPGSHGGSTSGSCGAENSSPRVMKSTTENVESSFVFVPPVEPSQEMMFVESKSRIVGEDWNRNTAYRIESCAARPGLRLQLPESSSGDATTRTWAAHYGQLRDGASVRSCEEEEEEARKRDTNPEDANAKYYLDATPSRPRPRPAEKIMRRGNESQEQQEASAARNNARDSSGSSIPNRVAQPNYRRPARARRRGIKDADKKPQRKGGGATGVSEGDGEDL